MTATGVVMLGRHSARRAGTAVDAWDAIVRAIRRGRAGALPRRVAGPSRRLRRQARRRGEQLDELLVRLVVGDLPERDGAERRVSVLVDLERPEDAVADREVGQMRGDALTRAV